MVDPLSIAGLAIAVLDDVISLSIWTANTIQDAQAFDEDTRRLQTLVASDVSRNSLLRKLLFAQAVVYGGHTLFEQFDRDVQEQTLTLLEESKDILQSGQNLLQRRYGAVNTSKGSPTTPKPISIPPSPSSSTTTLVAPVSPSSVRRKSNPPVLTLLRWSMIDKKRVEGIISKFNQHNQRLLENVKLWCLADQLGVDLGHLRHLQSDQVSRDLGFNLDATLRLTRKDEDTQQGTLELSSAIWQPRLAASSSSSQCPAFRTVHHEDATYLVENYKYEVPQWWSTQLRGCVGEVDPGTKVRIEALARLLHEPKEQEFLVPHCLGWSYLAQEKRVSLVYPVVSTPISLLTLLSDSKGHQPGLGERFRLGAGLAACIAQLHMVGWLHESFRSDNILFWPSTTNDTGSNGQADVDITKPAVLGFEFSRPDHLRSAAFNTDFDPSRDLYRHPERQGDPLVSFTKLHDIYALGVVLLEIGLWMPAVSLQKDNFREARLSDRYLIRKQLLHHAEQRLERRVGPRYKEVVVKCLKGDFGIFSDNKQDLKLQQAFRSQVVDVLQKAADAL